MAEIVAVAAEAVANRDVTRARAMFELFYLFQSGLSQGSIPLAEGPFQLTCSKGLKGLLFTAKIKLGGGLNDERRKSDVSMSNAKLRIYLQS